MKKTRLLILGFDGLDYDLLKEYLKQNNKAYLHKLDGALLPTIPQDPLWKSGACWTTIYTGLSKETHGILETVGEPEKWRVFKHPCVWNVLNEYGITVGLFGLPCTYPPKSIMNFWVCGFPTPNNAMLCFPRHLKDTYLKNHVVDFLQVPIGVEFTDFGFIEDDLYYKKYIDQIYAVLAENPNYLFDLNNKVYSKHLETIKRLYTDIEVDVAFIQFSLIDHIGHFIPQLQSGETWFNYVYSKFNEILTDMHSFFKPDSLMIVSDHGFKSMRSSGRHGHTGKAVTFFSGENINVDFDKEISNMDIMPSICFMLDVPHPKVEGMVNYNLFKDQYLTRKNEEAVKRRMRILGY